MAPAAADLPAILSEAEFDAITPRPGETMTLDWSDRDIHPLSA